MNYIRLDAEEVLVGRPAGPERGSVLVFHEIFGINGYIERVVGRLVQQGYSAYCPNLYGPGVRSPFSYDEVATAMRAFDASARLRFDTIVPLLAEHIARTAQGEACHTIGFCVGASLALTAASRIGAECTVAFYPIGAMAHCSENLRLRKVLLVYGEEDPLVPVESILSLEKYLAAVGTNVKTRSFRGGHAFDCDDRETYEAQSSCLAWDEVWGFLGGRT